MVSKLRNGAIRLGNWYRTPTGLLSLVFIAVTVGLVIAQLTAIALLVAVAWVAFTLPHKLTRERRDWELALSGVQRGGEDQLAAVRAETHRLSGDMASMPTVDEVQRWQQSIEKAQSQSNKRIQQEQASLAESFDSVASLIELQDDKVGRLEAQLAKPVDIAPQLEELEQRSVAIEQRSEAIEKRTEAIDLRLTDLQEGIGKRPVFNPAKVSSELQAVGALYSLLEPSLPLPPLGGWSVSAEAAVMMTRAIIRQEPELVVETGSGTSTVLAALALAKNGHGRMIALEHDRGYALKTRQMLRDRGLEKFATVVDAPLVDHQISGETFRWYDVPAGEIDIPVELLLVDGPPGTTGPLARYPAIPLLYDHLTPSVNVLMDDADREEEQEIAARWQSEFRLVHVDQTKDTELSVLRFAAEPTH